MYHLKHPRRLETDEKVDGALWVTCPGCGVRDDTCLVYEIQTGIVKCGYCGTVSREPMEVSNVR